MVFQQHRAAPSPPSLPPSPPPVLANDAAPHFPDVVQPRSQRIPAEQAPGVLTLRRTVPGFALLDAQGTMVSPKGYVAPLNSVLTTDEAFGGDHDSDLHFVLYGARLRSTGAFEHQVPRLNQAALPFLAHVDRLAVDPAIKAQLQDIEVVGVALAVDFDLPNHMKWDASRVTEAKALFNTFVGRCTILAAPSLFYTTAKGLRLVWVLTEAIPIEGAGGLHDLLGGLVATCHIHGLQADPSCIDWTRIFRLPRVMREDEDANGIKTYSRTATQSYLRQSWGRVDFEVNEEISQDGTVLAYHPASFRGLSQISYDEAHSAPSARTLAEKWRHKFSHAPASATVAMRDVYVGGMPNDAEVARLLHVSDTGKEAPLARSVRTWLETRAAPKGKDAKPLASAVEACGYLYYGQSFITDPNASGQLHAGVLRLSCALGYTLKERLSEQDVSPQLLFALVYQVARRSNLERDPTQQRPDSALSSEVWSGVEWAYRQFRSQVILEDMEEKEAREAQEILVRNTLAETEGCRIAFRNYLQECINRSGGSESVSAEDTDWLDMHWESCLILELPDGLKSVATISQMGDVYYSKTVKSLGGVHSLLRDNGHTLINPHKPPSPTGLGELYKSEVSLLGGNGMVVPTARLSRLIKLNTIEFLPSKDGLTPQFVEAIKGMRFDIQPRESPMVAEWLHRLAGPQWIDKLLDWLWAYPRISQPSCGLYIEGDPGLGKGMLGLALMHMTELHKFAPFEEVVEQFQDSLMQTPFVWLDEHQSKSVAHTRSIMHTFKKLVTGEFKSLNQKGKAKRDVDGHWRVLMTANTATALSVEDDMNDQDSAALTVRLLHLKAQPEAGEFLASLGGQEGTRGWVERDIPQHIAWLVENRRVIPGKRLLVEGVRSDYHESLAVNRPSTDMTLRTIAIIMKDLNRHSDAAAIEGDMLLLTSSNVFTTFNTQFGGTKVNQLTPKAIEASLKSMSLDSHPHTQRLGAQKKVARVWRIPLKSLFSRLYQIGENIDFRSQMDDQTWHNAAKDVLTPQELSIIEEEPKIVSKNRMQAVVQVAQLPPPPPPPLITGTAASMFTSPTTPSRN